MHQRRESIGNTKRRGTRTRKGFPPAVFKFSEALCTSPFPFRSLCDYATSDRTLVGLLRCICAALRRFVPEDVPNSSLPLRCDSLRQDATIDSPSHQCGLTRSPAASSRAERMRLAHSLHVVAHPSRASATARPTAGDTRSTPWRIRTKELCGTPASRARARILDGASSKASIKVLSRFIHQYGVAPRAAQCPQAPRMPCRLRVA